MTATLPAEVQSVFERFRTTELTTIDELGQPITWPVLPRYRPGAPCIDVTTHLGADARRNSQVALLFSNPAGSGLDRPPMVLVQGSADPEDDDGVATVLHVRPERVYVWSEGEPDAEPVLYDAHMEEVRSGHSEEPERYHAPPAGGVSRWDSRLSALGGRYPTAVLTLISPDGFPFSVRVRVRLDAASRWIEIDHSPQGLPLAPGLACLTTEGHGGVPGELQVRGDLVLVKTGWVLVPHALSGRKPSAGARRGVLGALRRLVRR